MTTNTDPHGAMPELPKPMIHEDDVWRIEFYTASQMREYARAAIQQAAGAVPEGAMDYALDILVAAGHITREKALQTRDITRQFYSGSSDHSVPCAGGGVTQPLTDEQVLRVYTEARRKWDEQSDQWNHWDNLGHDEIAGLICRETELQHDIAPRPESPGAPDGGER